jgi:Fur family transcriptional regulator, ferric uptake regulator
MAAPSHRRRAEREAGIRVDLRAAGLRVTTARIAVLELLRQASGPLSHAELVEQLEGRAGDPATVFRNLGALSDAGLAVRADLGDHVWRFESRSASAREPASEGHEHPHFLCRACGSVECIPELEIRPRRGQQVPRAIRERSVEIQFKGLCDDCSPD